MKKAALIFLAIIALAGCSTTTKTAKTSSESPTPTYSSTPNTVTPSTSAAPAAPSTTPRGNIPKQIGQQGGVVVSDADSTSVFTFTVDSITPNYQCTGPYADPSANGQYLAVTISVTGGPGISKAGGAIKVASEDFQIIGQDGVIENATSSVRTFKCVDDANVLPQSGVGQGVTGKGTVVLDTKNASGFLVFIPRQISLTNGHGWEYTF